ncbi:MAG: hypothetical protein WBE58_06890 [Verrucomicrobiales bacterium]
MKVCFPHSSSLALIGAMGVFCHPASSRSETIVVDGESYNGAEIVDLAPNGVFFSSHDGGVVLPWEQVTTAHAMEVKKRLSGALINVRAQSVWVAGHFKGEKEGFTLVYADGRRRANFDIEKNIPKDFDYGEASRPKASYYGAKAQVGWVIIKDLPSNTAAPETSTQMIVYPTGETKTIQLDDQTDPVELPIMTVQSPAWVEERTWTNSDGKSLRARLQFADDTTAYLELSGRIVPYPLEKLSPLDRQVAKQCSSTALPILVPVKVR